MLGRVPRDARPGRGQRARTQPGVIHPPCPHYRWFTLLLPTLMLLQSRPTPHLCPCHQDIHNTRPLPIRLERLSAPPVAAWPSGLHCLPHFPPLPDPTLKKPHMNLDAPCTRASSVSHPHLTRRASSPLPCCSVPRALSTRSLPYGMLTLTATNARQPLRPLTPSPHPIRQRFSLPPSQRDVSTLHWAAIHRQLSLADKLIARGADIEAKDEEVQPPHCHVDNSTPFKLQTQTSRSSSAC
jgi:hypothetical protein